MLLHTFNLGHLHKKIIVIIYTAKRVTENVHSLLCDFLRIEGLPNHHLTGVVLVSLRSGADSELSELDLKDRIEDNASASI